VGNVSRTTQVGSVCFSRTTQVESVRFSRTTLVEMHV
jgi:hypothetical protein